MTADQGQPQTPPPGGAEALETVPGTRTSRMATGALVLGILGLLTAIVGIGLLLAIIAVVFGIVSLVQIGNPETQLEGKGRAIAGIVLGGVTLLIMPVCLILAGLLLPPLSSARAAADRVKCMNNLKQIGLAVMMYEDRHGTKPASFTDLYGEEGLLMDTAVLQCPRAPEDEEFWMSEDGSLSGDYRLHPALGERAFRPTEIIAWEAAGNHDDAVNVLYGDGHVETVETGSPQEAERFVRALDAGDIGTVQQYARQATGP